MSTKYRIRFSHTALFIALAILLAMCMVGFTAPSRTLTVVADGETHRVHTSARTVRGILADAHIALGKADRVVADRKDLAEGAVLTVKRAKTVVIRDGMQHKEVTVAADTAEEAVIAAGYSPDAYVTLIPAATPVTEQSVIPVGKYTATEETVEEAVPFRNVQQPNDRMRVGEERVISQGRDGKRTVTYRVLHIGNRVVGRQEMAQTVLTEPIDRVAEVGTRDMVETSRGAERFTKVIRMEATAYHPMDGDGRGITYSGIPARRGVVAVDPNVVPIGTRVYVPGYGEAVAADTGGAIIGNRIDLCMESYDECYAFGRQAVDVYVLN
ncbi:MAG: 3D domain-containing protein [Veillonellaceae bacterium]|nr:3D domain-containing protein [Veillonellaceae bacterium]